MKEIVEGFTQCIRNLNLAYVSDPHCLRHFPI